MGLIHNTQSSIKHNSFHLKDIDTQFFAIIFFQQKGKNLIGQFYIRRGRMKI